MSEESLTPKECAELAEILAELEMTDFERHRRNIVEADRQAWADAKSGRRPNPKIAERMRHCRELAEKVRRGDPLTRAEREEWAAREARHKELDRMFAEHQRILAERSAALCSLEQGRTKGQPQSLRDS
jgi:hypothetical protein